MAALATRSLLTLSALTVLAERAGVPLPASWHAEPTEAEPDPVQVLLDADVLDGATGSASEQVRNGLRPLAAPLVTIEVQLSRTHARSDSGRGPADSFVALVAVGDTGLVSLLRRDGVGLVELTLAGADALSDSLDRLLASAPGADGNGERHALSLSAFVELSSIQARVDVASFARDRDLSEDDAEAVAQLLGSTTHILRCLVVGDRALGSPPVGQVLLYLTERGWFAVRGMADPDRVVMAPSGPLAIKGDIAALVAGTM